MVGVPGKSKGCHTCRRRKIKCDLAKPKCDRCTRTGRECEGYARGAVFLNRTPQGMLKREHLDEAEPRQSPTSSSESPEPGVNSSSALTSRTSSSNSESSLSPKTDFHVPVSFLNVLTAGFESYFVDRQVPLESRRGADTFGIWPTVALTLTDRGPALDNAFAAVAFNRAGQDQDDPVLVVKGRHAYGRALRACSRSLNDPRALRSDQLLAALNLLKSYEIQEATSNSTSGHDNHTAGLMKLIEWRGKDVLQSEHNRLLISELRFSAMIVALQYRKRSPLDSPLFRPTEWLTPSDAQQSLYNYGFDMAALAEEMDISLQDSGKLNLDQGLEYSTRVLGMKAGLKQWHRKFLEKAELTLEWSNADALPNELPLDDMHGGVNAQRKFRVGLLWQRVIMMDFWTLRIGICIFLQTFQKDVPTNAEEIGPERSLGETMLMLAENIAHTAQLCLAPHYGIYGQARTIYAIRVGLVPARTIPTPRAKALLAKLERLIEVVSRGTAKNVAAKSKLSDNWRTLVHETNHEFVKR